MVCGKNQKETLEINGEWVGPRAASPPILSICLAQVATHDEFNAKLGGIKKVSLFSKWEANENAMKEKRVS